MNRSTPEALELFHQGALVFAQMEANGMRIDVPYLDNAIVEVAAKIKAVEEEMMQDDVWRQWKKRHGTKSNITSTAQLATLLFDVMGYQHRGFTKSSTEDQKRYRGDEDTFQHIDLPFVRKFTEASKLRKLHGTYLMGVRTETVDGWLHPIFNLHTARSWRSSSEAVNFQNQPARDPVITPYIRQAFIPRSSKYYRVEADAVGAEVKVGYCYHKDKRMKQYLEDKTTDMHRDMAMQCYCIPDPKQITKDIRFAAKSFFTFAEFYGDFWLHVGQNLWEQISLEDLRTADNTPVKDWLKRKGITKLGKVDGYDPEPESFLAHIKDVEHDFWGNRFAGYAQWKKDFYRQYQKVGGFGMYTGFWAEGIYARNQVVNYPIQGSSFHCLLWTIIRLQRWLNKHKMKTRIIGQIHDSIVMDVYETELQDVLNKVRDLFQVQLAKAWDWIVTDLELEAEVSPLGESWYAKAPWIDKNGVWVPKVA